MAEEQYDWRDPREIDRFVKDWREIARYRTLNFKGKIDPIDELRSRVARGLFAGENLKAVQDAIAAADAEAHRMSAAGRVEREERAIAAAERSADAADRSARAAKSSARWSMWALAVALGALFVSAWPHIKVGFE